MSFNLASRKRVYMKFIKKYAIQNISNKNLFNRSSNPSDALIKLL